MGAGPVTAPPPTPAAQPTLYEVIPEPAVAAPRVKPLVATLDAAMKEHIERALVAARGRIEGRRGAAALLAINPHTLRARMRKLGIEWSRYRDAW